MTEVKDKLSQDLPKLSEWFTENFMILNPDKCHYMCLGKDAENDISKFCDKELKSSELETVLGIEIDHKLTFESHVKTLCSKAANKLSALQRIVNIIDEEKRNLLFNAIIKSQFSYCPLIWMFCSRRSNNLTIFTKELLELLLMIILVISLNFLKRKENLLFINEISKHS